MLERRRLDLTYSHPSDPFPAALGRLTSCHSALSPLSKMLSGLLLDEDTSSMGEEHRLTREANLESIMEVFPRLRFGLDVNMRFNAVDAFEFTPELAAFDLLRIECVYRHMGTGCTCPIALPPQPHRALSDFHPSVPMIFI